MCLPRVLGWEEKWKSFVVQMSNVQTPFFPVFSSLTVVSAIEEAERPQPGVLSPCQQLTKPTWPFSPHL